MAPLGSTSPPPFPYWWYKPGTKQDYSWLEFFQLCKLWCDIKASCLEHDSFFYLQGKKIKEWNIDPNKHNLQKITVYKFQVLVILMKYLYNRACKNYSGLKPSYILYALWCNFTIFLILIFYRLLVKSI